jgi:hypothetical protein
MSRKQYYQQFCNEYPDIPVFSQPWWLDTVCPNSWDVLLIKDNDNKTVAVFPYCIKKTKLLFSQIMMPPLTQKMGPYIVYDKNKDSKTKKISYEHNIYNKIIDQLPNFNSFFVQFDWKYKNWLPFYWRGFKQTTRYTYILENIKDHDSLEKNYSKGKKQPLLKARNTLQLKFDLPPEDFYSFFKEVIHNRNQEVSFSKDFFYSLYSEVYAHKSGKVLYCTDTYGNIHALNMIIWDNECAYYLIAMRKKEYNTSGGTEFLVDEAIKYASQFVNRFDFEGSMMKGVEESYRHYGANQIEYYAITKNDRILYKIRSTIKNYLFYE